MSLIEALVEQSDPANAALLGVIYWRLDRRLKSLSVRFDQEVGAEEPSDGEPT